MTPATNNPNTPKTQPPNQKKQKLLVGSRILESDQPSAVHFSQDLNHFSVGSKSSSPTKQH
jgi:hypothetical protein